MALIVAVVLGVAFLAMFYRAVQLNWPESYFSATEVSSYSISTSPWRYLTFRFLPVYMTCIFVAVTLERIGSSALLGSMSVAVTHGFLTSGRAIAEAMVRWPSHVRRHRIPVLMLHGLVVLGLALIGFLAYMTSDGFAPIVPTLNELSATLWTGLVAGIIGAFIVRVSRGHPISDADLVDQSMKRIPPHLWYQAGELAGAHDADPHLVRAVMVVENIQRPAWFRSLEPGSFSSTGLMLLRNPRKGPPSRGNCGC